MNLSYFGGLRVKPSPTYVTFVTIRFHPFPETKINAVIHEFSNKFTLHKSAAWNFASMNIMH